MGLFDRFRNPKLKNGSLLFSNSRYGIPEGAGEQVDLMSLLVMKTRAFVKGTINVYKTYRDQVKETYRKYNGESDFGNDLVKAIISVRSAVIMGEGVNIKCNNPDVAKVLNDFLKENKLIDGARFMNGVVGSEMTGYCYLTIYFDPIERKVRVRRTPAQEDEFIIPSKNDDPDEPGLRLVTLSNGERQPFVPQNGTFVYIKTGGDDTNHAPVTRVGIALTDIENYDRALKDLRINNYFTARVTPVFKAATQQEADSQAMALQKQGWQVGDAYVGTVGLEYITPGQGAHENLIMELQSNAKAISSVTGVLIHWLGHVELLSNRSTADTLFEALRYNTVKERMAWQNGLYEVCVKALELMIDNGLTDVPFDTSFQVSLPMLDASSLASRISAISKAYHDRVISRGDYQNNIPGINPAESDEEIEAGKAYDPTIYMNTNTGGGTPAPVTTGADGGAKSSRAGGAQ